MHTDRLLTVVLLVVSFAFVHAPLLHAQVPSGDVDARVETLLDEMTLEEKVGQMTQVTLDVVTPPDVEEPTAADPERLREAIVAHHVGSILNVDGHALTAEEWRALLTNMQDVATEETRLGIPVIYGIDAVHGANYLTGATIFPHNFGLAATFNTELARTAGRITARETRASGIPWNFAPVLDIGREPMWPRFYETLGEDVLLAQEMGAALVRGMEGDDLSSNEERVASTMKHFVGYSGPESGRDRTTAQISERLLRSHYLPPFQTATDAGAETVMINSGDINGVPVHASEELLTDVLREEMGFDGLIVTDWYDIIKLHEVHHISESNKESVRMAIEAGIDMSMVPNDFSFYDAALKLVQEGTISEARIDESVRRILRLKMQLGLMDDPYPPESPPQLNTAAAQEANLKAARQSLTLLKNESGLLPLSEDADVLVAGPAADSEQALLGGWSYRWQGDGAEALTEEDMTLVEAMRRQGRNVRFVRGTGFTERDDISAAARAAEQADVVVLAVGENSYAETPGDITDLRLPEPQRALAAALAETDTPIATILVEGRPRIMPEVFAASKASLMAYLPGAQGARAIADVLYGEVSPSGRLSFSYPQYTGDTTPYDRLVTTALGDNQNEVVYEPQFPFGHGLSYTTFEYSDLSLSADQLGAGETMTATVDVTNTGERASGHSVLLFARDLVASVVPRERRLKGFHRVRLEPGETETVSFEIAPEDLALVGRDMVRDAEAGDFRLTAGGQEANFTYTDE